MIQKWKPDNGGCVQTATNLDGAYFGGSFAHLFMECFANYIEMPPKVYLYQPQIKGFRIVG